MKFRYQKFELPKRIEHEIQRFPTTVMAEIDYQILLYINEKSNFLPKMYVDHDGDFYFIEIQDGDIKIIK
jgi:hypothetical protein